HAAKRARADDCACPGLGRDASGGARDCNTSSPGAAGAGVAAPGHGADRTRRRSGARRAPRACAGASKRADRRYADASRGASNVIEVADQDGVTLLCLAHGKANAMSLEAWEASNAK